MSTEFRRHGIPRNFLTSEVISAQFRRNSAKFRGIPRNFAGIAPEITSVFRGMPKCHFRGNPIRRVSWSSVFVTAVSTKPTTPVSRLCRWDPTVAIASVFKNFRLISKVGKWKNLTKRKLLYEKISWQNCYCRVIKIMVPNSNFLSL